MTPINICLAVLGHLPRDLSIPRIQNWQSDVFRISGVETYPVHRDADGPDWQYTDEALAELLPDRFKGDFMFAIANVPLADNYYGRRIGTNRSVITTHEVAEIMRYANIPLENAVLRLLYSAALIYKRFGDGIPRMGQNHLFTHDETRGCLFDMNPYKPDLVASCHEPILCPDCIGELGKQKVPRELIGTVQKEIKRIKKPLYYRLLGWVKQHPVMAIVMSGITAIVLGIISSVIGSFIYGLLA